MLLSAENAWLPARAAARVRLLLRAREGNPPSKRRCSVEVKDLFRVLICIFMFSQPQVLPLPPTDPASLQAGVPRRRDASGCRKLSQTCLCAVAYHEELTNYKYDLILKAAGTPFPVTPFPELEEPPRSEAKRGRRGCGLRMESSSNGRPVAPRCRGLPHPRRPPTPTRTSCRTSTST